VNREQRPARASRLPGCAAFSASKPRVLFTGRFEEDYDVAPDGRFLMVADRELSGERASINLVLNWFQDLERRAPHGKR
jgi:hypothetical protein